MAQRLRRSGAGARVLRGLKIGALVLVLAFGVALLLGDTETDRMVGM